MARKRYKPEEIVAKLRQVDVLVSQGQNMVDAIRQRGERGDVLSVAPGVWRAPLSLWGTFSGLRTGSLGAGSLGLGVGFGNTTGLGIVSGISMGSEPG